MKYIILFFLFMSTAFSHPVIYKDGWVIHNTFMDNMNHLTTSYSASPRYSFALNANHFEDLNNYQDYTLGMNFLLKRWLAKDSQGNIYAGAHAGYYYDDLDEGLSGHLFLSADWESRKHYTMFKVKSFLKDNDERYKYMLRYGFAPFIAGMDTLQAWFIVQGEYFEDIEKRVMLTPMLRFFYKNVLWEVGHSTRGHLFLSLMVHY